MDGIGLYTVWDFIKRWLSKHSDRCYDLLALTWLIICLFAGLNGSRFLDEFGEDIDARNSAVVEEMSKLSELE